MQVQIFSTCFGLKDPNAAHVVLKPCVVILIQFNACTENLNLCILSYPTKTFSLRMMLKKALLLSPDVVNDPKHFRRLRFCYI